MITFSGIRYITSEAGRKSDSFRCLSYAKSLVRFQEQNLSRRSLIFVNEQVYFRCHEQQTSEDTIGDTGGSSGFTRSLYRDNRSVAVQTYSNNPLEDYRDALMHYSERVFSVQADVLLGLEGICRRAGQKMKCSFLQGIPTAAFDDFLVFSHRGSILRRRRQFPSYSWAGWIGGIKLKLYDEFDDWYHPSTWIKWYTRSSTGVIKLVCVALPSTSLLEDKSVVYGHRNRSLFGGRFNINSSRTSPTVELSQSINIPPYPILQFWTLSIRFEISKFDVFAASASIIDCNAIVCGTVDMDGFEEDDFFQESMAYEFILVSELITWTHDCEFAGGDVHDALQPYNVLLLEWKNGIAERRGIGVVCRAGVERALSPGPCWKEILLG